MDSYNDISIRERCLELAGEHKARLPQAARKSILELASEYEKFLTTGTVEEKSNGSD